jgi:hypothetical protein
LVAFKLLDQATGHQPPQPKPAAGNEDLFPILQVVGFDGRIDFVLHPVSGFPVLAGKRGTWVEWQVRGEICGCGLESGPFGPVFLKTEKAAWTANKEHIFSGYERFLAL